MKRKTKDDTINLRITPELKRKMVKEAHKQHDGNVSLWLRKLLTEAFEKGVVKIGSR